MPEPIRITGLESVRALLAALGGNLEEASRLAQNKMAYELRLAEQDQMRSDLDRPTPFSVQALMYKKAETSAAALGGPAGEGAAVYMVDKFAHQGAGKVGPDEYLGVQALGGVTAGPRRSEKWFQSAGIIGPNIVWVPDRAVKLDAYGNIPGGPMSRMITDFDFNPYARTANKQFALWGPRGKPHGVLAKIGDTWHPYIWFVERRTYQARFDFYGRGDREISEKWQAIWEGYLQQALDRAAG